MYHGAPTVVALSYFIQSRSIMNAYEIIRTFGVVVLLAAASVQCSHEDIHKWMSVEELQNVFHTDSADSVPVYEIVKLHMPERLHRRDLSSGRHIHTIAFGENINLWLHPINSTLAGRNTPVYCAKNSTSKPEGVEFIRQDGVMARVGQIFEDPIKMASLVIGTEPSGKTRVNGFIESERIAIRSLPRRVVDEYSRRRRAIDGPEDPQNSPYHVAIRMNEPFKGNYSHSPVKKTRLPERSARSIEAIPDTLYPKVLVVLDNTSYHAFDTAHGHDINCLLEYLLAFWNGVDLKYRSVDAPKIRFHISAIVLEEDAGAMRYIAESIVNTPIGGTFVYVNRAQKKASKFWYGAKDTFPFESYDIVSTMTRYRLGDFWNQGNIEGEANIASACQRNDTLKTVEALTLFKDNGVFSGVHAAAHEIGHVFGVQHDFDKDCPAEDGFLMAGQLYLTNNTSDFSSCSLKVLQEILNDRNLTCLYNRPKDDGEVLPRLMPGKMKNLEAQCKALKGGSSCQDQHPDHSICMKLFCFNEKGECVDAEDAALDGTKCGSEKDFCLHQRCVSL